MKRHPIIPLLPFFLLLMWLLLNDSLSVSDIALGVLFAVFISIAVTRLRPLPAWPRRLHVAIGLCWHVFVDIVHSNLNVGRIILGASRRQPNISFIKIPLDMSDPHGLAMLTIIITGCPGTVWAGHDAKNKVLTLHVLDLHDEAFWVRTVKQRYERPLMEIFE